MPAIKCPVCGHRHFQIVSMCINCGAPLAHVEPAQAPDLPTIAHARSSTNHDNMAEYDRFLAATAATRGQDQTRDKLATPCASLSYPEDAPAPRQLVRREEPRQAWRKQTEVQTYEPYETALDVALPDPFSEPRAVAISEAQVLDAERWKSEKFPWYFSRTRPAIAGKVIHMETREEIIDYPDLFAALATLLVELLWVLINIQQEKENDRVVMTIVRMQMDDGSLKDARLRGNMRGADLSLGDHVSLWGWRRRGVLFVRRGFNHTTKGVVSTSSSGLMLPALIAIVLIVGGIIFVPAWAPAVGQLFSSVFGPLFSIFQHASLKN